jgi:hypothetical protein
VRAYPRHLGRAARELELGQLALDSFDEELHRIRVSYGFGLRSRLGQRQRLQRIGLLAGNSKRLAAGGQDRRPFRTREQDIHELRAAIQQMLAVVQDQQDLARLQMRAHRLGCGRACSFAHAECLRDRRRHQRGIADRRQFGQPYAIAIGVDDFGRGLQREPGLADATRADDRDQSLAGKQPLDLDDLTLASDE